jgi:uncharacterized protein (DUF983 family)
MKKSLALSGSATEAKAPSKLDPLYPLNLLECPRCRIPFRGYEVNVHAECQECGQGYYVVKARKDFFVLT